MATTVTMPQLGETVTEGTILRWAKQEGDTVAEDEVLLEISTDKVDTEVPSPAAGTILEILVGEGETVSVGTPLAVIGDPGEKGEAEEPEAEEPAAEEAEEPEAEEPAAEEAEEPEAEEPAAEEAEEPEAEEPAAEEAEEPEVEEAEEPEVGKGEEPEERGEAVLRAASDGAPLSPVVRRLAAEHDVDLSAISGTGREGRITRRDVEEHIAQREQEPEPEPEPAPAPVPAAAEAEAEAPAAELEVVPAAAAAEEEPEAEEAPAPTPEPVPLSAARDDEVEEISRLRVRIAENMMRAKQSAAHVWTSVEVDYEAVEQVRRRHREAFREREGFSLTYLPFITRATVDALEAYPVVNSSFDLEGKRRIVHKRIDLGFGVDLDQEGLLVVTVRGADGLGLRGIAREVRRVAEKARSGNLEPDDVTGSTFTLTNPGPFGSFLSAPIINVPNVAILSTETVAKRPVVITDERGNDAIAIRHIGYLGLTWDHRAFDGSTAVLFLARIKENLETWDWEQELT